MRPTPQRSLKQSAVERQLFASRATVGFGILVLCLLALVVRFYWLQVVQYDQYSTRAHANRVHLRHLPPPRGLIYDRNGVILAGNKPAYRLEVTPERVDDMDGMLNKLSDVVPLSASDLKDFRKELGRHRSFERIPLKFDLSEGAIARFAVNRWRFPGVDIQPYLDRVYPEGEYFVHIVGYVGRIDADDLKGRNSERYAGTTHIGKNGIERYYESQLHGMPGYELAEVNVSQRPLRVMDRQPPVAGSSLMLTIDARLQKAAVDALHGRSGSVVAIDPRNGEILAMVSRPGYDPNLFVNGISQRDYSALLNNRANPFLNRALRGIYPPGSTIKPFMALAGVVLGLRTPEDRIYSTGTWYLPNATRGYRDDRRGGFGWVDLHRSIVQSVNTYFYQLAHEMGIDRLTSFMKRFGFGQPTGVDLIGEAAGVVPSRQWKRVHKHQPWYPGETVLAGIGQGYWAVTPLQLAHAVATLAEGGVAYRPHLLLATMDASGAPNRVPKPPAVDVGDAGSEAYEAVRLAMIDVVNSSRGTATGLGEGFPFLVAGKTGTAERYSRTDNSYRAHMSTEELAKLHRALFVTFAPAHNPQIAIAVIVDHGAWGSSAAAPVARELLQAWVKTHPGQFEHGAGDGDKP